ncbi:MAG: hypothetical protein U0794_09635 [Isosphaeraceae bacterium]
MHRRTNGGRFYPIGLGLALLVGFGTPTTGRVEAATIQANRLVPATPANLGPRWNRFLAGGPSLWSRVAAPPFRSYLVLPRVNGQLIETPFVDYLLWRRSFNPTRFDFYHPNVARQFAAAIAPTVNPTPSINATSTPSTTPPSFNPQPQTVVPEPDTLWIGMILVAGALGWRWRLRMIDATAVSSS